MELEFHLLDAEVVARVSPATVVAAQEPARPPPSTADGEPVRAPPAAARNPYEDWLESTEYRRPPKAWKCDALFYDAGDGCDCGCGAVDPDCNRLHHAEGGELEDMLWGCGDGDIGGRALAAPRAASLCDCWRAAVAAGADATGDGRYGDCGRAK